MFKEFLGIEEDETLQDKEDAKRILTNMKLCDPCNIENFFCQAKEYYYSVKNSVGLLNIIFAKLPFAMANFIQNKTKEKEKVTLGMTERYAREYRQYLCIKKSEKPYIEKVNIKCCKQLDDVPQEYGCTPKRCRKPIYKYKRPYKKFNKYKRKYYPRKYNTYKKPWKNRYQNRYRKRNTSYKNPKYCPKGKKNCRCWKCQEEGHYANECPQNDKYKDNKLKMIYSIGYEPIEEEYEEGEIIEYDTYSLESYEESESEEDTDSEHE